jgi:hypothetical protein
MVQSMRGGVPALMHFDGGRRLTAGEVSCDRSQVKATHVSWRASPGAASQQQCS